MDLQEEEVIKNMSKGIEMIKIGTAARLQHRFVKQYGDPKAMQLAVAVTNELFSERPTVAEALDFEMQNKALIEQELVNLKQDVELRLAVTQALRVRAAIKFAKEKGDPVLLAAPLKKLERMGILVEGGESPEATSFLNMAGQWVTTNCKPKAI